ncbi:hypothetical protein BJ912DRAFT_1128362 [Pholiota molesta]|nr:hypothetical protein BJ912DRAFT_1128362 [Pholiota molesta]
MGASHFPQPDRDPDSVVDLRLRREEGQREHVEDQHLCGGFGKILFGGGKGGTYHITKNAFALKPNQFLDVRTQYEHFPKLRKRRKRKITPKVLSACKGAGLRIISMSFPRFAPTTTTTSLNSPLAAMTPPRPRTTTDMTRRHDDDVRRGGDSKGRPRSGRPTKYAPYTILLPFTATRSRSANDDDGHHPPRRHVRPPLPSSTTTSPAPQRPPPATSPLRCPPAVTTSPTHDACTRRRRPPPAMYPPVTPATPIHDDDGHHPAHPATSPSRGACTRRRRPPPTTSPSRDAPPPVCLASAVPRRCGVPAPAVQLVRALPHHHNEAACSNHVAAHPVGPCASTSPRQSGVLEPRCGAPASLPQPMTRRHNDATARRRNDDDAQRCDDDDDAQRKAPKIEDGKDASESNPIDFQTVLRDSQRQPRGLPETLKDTWVNHVDDHVSFRDTRISLEILSFFVMHQDQAEDAQMFRRALPYNATSADILLGLPEGRPAGNVIERSLRPLDRCMQHIGIDRRHVNASSESFELRVICLLTASTNFNSYRT